MVTVVCSLGIFQVERLPVSACFFYLRWQNLKVSQNYTKAENRAKVRVIKVQDLCVPLV